MKKIVSILLCLALSGLCVLPAAAAGTLASDGSFGAYERVFILGVDGAGRFFRDADTPNFDRIFADGAVDYTARAEIVTVSAQNWGSILTGVSCIRHGMTNNSTGAAARSSDTKYPSIYTYVRRAFPDAELAAFGHWSNINHGIIENDINVTKHNVNDDEKTTQAVCDYLDAGNAPKLFFVQLDDVDHAGHEYGSKAPAYFDAIRAADVRLGKIYDAIERNGLLEDSLIIVVADHGHLISGGHWGLTMRETNVTLALAGKTVIKGGTLDRDARNRDVSAIALYALGVERPSHMSSRVPGSLFTGVAGERRAVKNDLFDTVLGAFTWCITLLTAWI